MPANLFVRDRRAARHAQRILLALAALWWAAAGVSHATASERAFVVTLDPAVASQPISGRLFVFLSQRERSEPRLGPNWFSPEPFFGVDVRDFAPSETRRVDDTADGYPASLGKLEPGKYYAQALLDHDFYSSSPGRGVGNLYSDVVEIEVPADAQAAFDLRLTNEVEAQPFPETEHVQEIARRSDLLSAFHGREVVEVAAIVLPESYAQHPERRYPVMYVIPGFGGSHRDALRFASRPEEPGVEFIRIMLSGNCKWGHHVYADSATNGPRGRALVEELIPHIDREFRTMAEPTARFVTGHSSGGWSSLWLQVNYPEVFGGCWSTSPDPVDFRDYQQVDLYAVPPLSLYFDEAGNKRPIARRGEEPTLWYESFGHMDDVLKRGGQLRSFEAVFSPLDDAGEPLKLWDRETGRIDPQVATAWEAYDIRLVLERHWDELAPKLAGKLHVITGSLDTFYLEGAVRKLAESLRALGSDAVVEIQEGKNHSDVLTAELAARIRREMREKFLEHHPWPVATPSPAGAGNAEK
ncbi:MAG: hypothetical protein KF708_18830 [Pirellulales bacterium]|nr:hypothetical protein [Pirellulales bacterium]